MACIASAKMIMRADILKPAGAPENSGTGHWEYVQNPDSGAIERKWLDDDPNTPDVVEGGMITVPCVARGIINAGIRSAGTTQKFSEIYENIDWVKMEFPTGYNVAKNDKVIRIRDLQGNIIWKEEELEGKPPTEFTVMGVTPVIGPFGKAVENMALLQRSEVQGV